MYQHIHEFHCCVQVYEVYGDHESMLTQPSNLALGILQAINGMHQD